MKKYLLLIHLILLCGISNAQERTFETVNSMVNSFAQDLIKNPDADEILIYKTGCIGCEIIGDCSCKIGHVRYFLFWKEIDKTYVKEINCCKTSVREQTDLEVVWEELAAKEEVIFGSEFKTEKKNVHYDFYEVKLMKKGSEKEIKMVDFYFNDDNKYQEHNSQQAAWKFQKLIELTLR